MKLERKTYIHIAKTQKKNAMMKIKVLVYKENWEVFQCNINKWKKKKKHEKNMWSFEQTITIVKK
jgi:hypothetical protein